MSIHSHHPKTLTNYKKIQHKNIAHLVYHGRAVKAKTVQSHLPCKKMHLQ